MSSSTRQPSSSSSTQTSHHHDATKKTLRPFNFLLITLVFPVVLVFQLYSFDPAPYPVHELTRGKSIAVPRENAHMLRGSEKIGVGKLWAPEDIAYDPNAGVIYTGCGDGWIKRVTVNGCAVEDWVNTGGMPLGIVRGHRGEVFVADAEKGLLKVTPERRMEVLTEEAEGVKFKLTDGVDISENGVIYFTDASYKYSFGEASWDFAEGRPYGRLMSYDPSTEETKSAG